LVPAIVCLLATVVLFSAVDRWTAEDAEASDRRAEDFDYWTLAPSWSPTYCGSTEGHDNAEQCGPGRRYAFVVHGLWPRGLLRQEARGQRLRRQRTAAMRPASRLVLPPVR
jgi:ribonuclease T2